MLWTVRHLWPSGDRFVFNCYRHWSLLVFLNRNGEASFINSKVGVTQRDPLAMIACGIGILPHIKNLKREIPDITQPWYYNNTVALGTFVRLATYFDSLTHQVPGHEYYPEPSKNVLIVLPENIEAEK